MTPAASLTTDRLTLRQPQASDLPAYTAYCVSDRARFVGGPFTAQQAFDKLAAMIGHWPLRGFGRYVITHNGAPIGHVGPLASVDDDTPELSWTLWDTAHEGQGFATEAAQTVSHHLMTDLNWPELLIRIQPDNHASRRIADRLGASLTDQPAPDWYPGCLTYALRKRAAA